MAKRSFKKAFKEQDEYYTPSCLVEILKPYLENFKKSLGKDNLTIWCPFDDEKSKYVTILESWGYNVIRSHIREGKDFFTFTPDEHFDITISNPPFSVKYEVFEKLTNIDTPFLMLMNIMALNYQEIGNLFNRIGSNIQFLIPDKKVSFNGHTSSFCSGYVSYKVLEKTEFVHLENNNTGDNFRE